MATPTSDLARCRGDFPSLERIVAGVPAAYLDGPAGTQVPRAVIEAISRAYATCNANTHGAFATSEETDRLLDETRALLAVFLGAPSARCISFGANMTTLAFALAHAIGRTLREGDEIVITALDHEANRGPWLMLAERGAVLREVALRPDGVLDTADLERAIGPRTRVVAIGLASNALGTVNDVALAARLARSAGARLVLDAVHYAPHFAIDALALDADFLLCSAYKFYGPHVGVLYAREGLLDSLPTDRLRTQEPAAPHRIETGTLNHPAIAGVKAAVEYIASWGEAATSSPLGSESGRRTLIATPPVLRARLVSAMAAIGAHERALASRYHAAVRDIPGVTVWGPGFDGDRRAPTVSITLEGMRAGDVARRLAERGIFVWDGDFYAARAVESLGLAERGGLLRTGVNMYNTVGEIERLLGALEDIAGGR